MCAIVGAIIGAAASVMQGAMAAQSANAQAAVYDRQAQMERDKGEYEAGLQDKALTRTLGKNRATALANGLALVGTPADVIADNAVEGALDVQAIRYGAEVNATNYEMQADVSRMQGRQAMAGGVFGAISPIIKGVSKTFMGGGAYE
nr:hypothetical protein [uncultured Cohaesibacter sp.]